MLTRALGIVALLTLAAGCQKMEDFTSSEHKFKARFPGKPKKEQQTGPFGVAVTMYGVESRDGLFGIVVSEMPIPANETPEMTQNRLDGARDGAIRNVGGTQKTSSAITLNNKYPGREFSASITQPKKGQVRARVYLVGPRLYQVMVMGTDSFATSSKADEFLNSFQVIE